MVNELEIKLSCSQCDSTWTIYVFLDPDGVFSIPDKYCPECLHILGRELIQSNMIVDAEFEPTGGSKPTNAELVDENESIDSDIETGTPDSLPEHSSDMDVSEDGVDSSENA